MSMFFDQLANIVHVDKNQWYSLSLIFRDNS